MLGIYVLAGIEFFNVFSEQFIDDAGQIEGLDEGMHKGIQN